MGKRCICLCALAVLLLSSLFAENEFLHISIRTTLLVSDPDEAGMRLEQWVREQGGYHTRISTDEVILRFPRQSVPEFRPYLENSFDQIIEYASSSQDLRMEIQSLESGIMARTEALERNLAMFSRADFDGTLSLEREILRLTMEREKLKGRLRKAENDRAMSQAVISLNFRTQPVPDTLPSAFDWINNLDVYEMVTGNFEPSFPGFSYAIDTPDGFALVSKRRIYRALSPEGVRFQIRKIRHYPQMDIQFWAGTFQRHMKESGFPATGNTGFFDSPAGKGWSAEWGLPFNEQDYIYYTAIIPKGRKLYFVEAAGEVSLFTQYRQALMASVGTLRK